MKEKILFCDIGNVLLFFDLFKSINRFLQIGSKSARQVLPRLFDAAYLADLETGKISAQQFYRQACAMFGMRLPFERFCAIWNDIFEENVPLTRWITRTSRSYRVFLVSNTNDLHFDHIATRYSFVQGLAGAIVSSRVGLRKPDPRIFVHALQRAGVSAKQVFYLDDVWEHVYSARRCGISAHRYTDPFTAIAQWNRFLKV